MNACTKSTGDSAATHTNQRRSPAIFTSTQMVTSQHSANSTATMVKNTTGLIADGTPQCVCSHCQPAVARAAP